MKKEDRVYLGKAVPNQPGSAQYLRCANLPKRTQLSGFFVSLYVNDAWGVVKSKEIVAFWE